ncbi:MAG: hypothetical protein Q8O37_15610 [Sulfuricellaceae bacterium]|nr:hypothetical protein [Sulfuricellaceae bacterium]
MTVGVGKNFDNQLGMFDKQVGTPIAGIAGDHHAGMKKCIGVCDPQLHVGDKSQARRAAQVLAQVGKQVACNDGMYAPHAHHGEYFTGNIFRPVRLFCLPGQIGSSIKNWSTLR